MKNVTKKGGIDYGACLRYCRQKAVDMAKDDICAFVENFCMIEDKRSGEIVPFNLWREQKETLLSFEKYKKNVILKARQLGFSWLVLSYAAAKMIAKPGYRVMCFSQGENEAYEMIRRVGRVLLPNMEYLFGEGGAESYIANSGEVKIIHANGRESVITAFASSGRSGRSFSADLIIFDEWATHPFAESLFQAAFPAINDGEGKFIGLSTMARGTFFEDVVVNYKEKGFNRIFIPWYADPRRDTAWYDETRRVMGDLILQEYPATVEEALTIPGGAFFPEFSLSVHVGEPTEAGERKGHIYYQAIDYGLDMLAVRWIDVDEEGRCRVYREFDAPDLIISEAAREIRRYWAEEGRPKAVLAPPDMWNRETATGRSRADIFRENGVDLTKSSSDIAAGCAALKELLYHEGREPRMIFERGRTARCLYDLSKIQKDEKRPDIYAKEPHELTHGVDALRYFAVYYIQKAPKKSEENSVVKHYRETKRRGKKGYW